VLIIKTTLMIPYSTVFFELGLSKTSWHEQKHL